MFTPGTIAPQAVAEERRADDRARRAMFGVVILLVAVAAIGVGIAFKFVAAERGVIVRQWQDRLGIVADSRTADISQWLDAQYSTLRALAQNASLQMYVGGLSAKAAGKDMAEAVEGAYLRNLLTATAQREGYVASRAQASVNANVAMMGSSGIAILDASGAEIVSTVGMPVVPPAARDAMNQIMQGKPGLIDIHVGAQGVQVIGFVVPIYSIQGDAGFNPPVGFIIGIKEVAHELLGRLVQPGETSETAESYLIRQEGNELVYLSALADGSEPLRRRLAADTPGLADAVAITQPGDFLSLYDYRGHEVLATSRRIAGTPWVLIRKIDRAEALGDSEHRFGVILTSMIVAVIGAMALSFGLWRQGASVRLSKAISRNNQMLEQVRKTAAFLQLVTDAQPTSIVTIDLEGRYTFANRHAAEEANTTPAAMIGKTLEEVIGPFQANIYTEINNSALKWDVPISQLHRSEHDPSRVFRSDHVPLVEDGKPQGVLLNLLEITDLMRERERGERVLEDLVNTLVALVDNRVPYSANHSARVSQISEAIAQEMRAPLDIVRAAKLAGKLINLGKLLVPNDILTKTGDLSPGERKTVQDKLFETAMLLKEVNFDIPVADALLQCQEYWDGSGYPESRKGEEICLPARIVAVANTFVSLVSQRSFRDAMGMLQACDFLLQESDTHFDRRPVAALINYLFNRGGSEQIFPAGVLPDGPNIID